MNQSELKDFLDAKVEQYNRPEFIETDPIQIPKRFKQKEDIEIMAFLVSTIAWGNRMSIIKSGNRLTEIMGNTPFDFVMDYIPDKMERLSGFVHRTFNNIDLHCFVIALQNIYKIHGGLESVFERNAQEKTLQPAIHHFKRIFFSIPHRERSEKHISDPFKNSAAKRVNMYLRWMVRNDRNGVDFGIWKTLDSSQLSCPLDVHTGNVARKLGLIQRKQNDSKALMELDRSLRTMDPKDPVKYDFALFGLGVFENF
jgi:uncharacterized protein (TIGR02757 family)